ncbi:unnamed protein product [Absidia cylindrospora]
MDYNDEFSGRRQRPSSHGLTSSSGMHSYYYGQEQQDDYGNPAHGLDTQSSSSSARSRIHTQQYQRHTHDVEQPYSRNCRASLSSYTNRHPFPASSTSNYNVKDLADINHHSHHIAPNKGQRKLQQQQSYYRPEPPHAGHHHRTSHAGWKMSSQCNRSSLSPTPPSLYDNNSSSPTSYTSSSSADNYQQHRNSNHRRKSSGDGSNQTMDNPHQPKRSILASSTTSSSLSSSSGSANYHHQTTSVKPISTNSNNTRNRHSYSDCYDNEQNPCQNSHEERIRRHSQDSMKPQTASSSVPRRVSTPKLRRVCSAKPYMEQQQIPPPPLPQGNDNDDDVLVATMDATSLSLSKTSADDNLVANQDQIVPNFWNPRSEKDILPVKRTLSRRIRGLLLPQRNKMDATMPKDQQVAINYQWSLARPLTPVNELSFDSDALLDDQENGVVDNPFYMISQSWDIADHIGLYFDEDEFMQMDEYVTSLQQAEGPALTPQMLSQQFLTRPYRRDLYRLRTIFIWIIQNINITDQYKLNDMDGQHNGSDDDDTATTTTVTNIIQPSKVSFRQRLTTRRNVSTSDHEEELEMPTVDIMHAGLLPEGGGNVDSFDDWLLSESAQQVLLHRTCSSSIGMANLFCEMAIAAGFHDTRVIYGYLRAPKDSLSTACMDDINIETNSGGVDDNDNVMLIQNHAWCCVKVEGEYRFVDCWLASPFQPQNKTKMEPHWFLTKPTDLIYTHFPQEPVDQCLEPTIHVSTFFTLPYVWASFFTQHIKMIRYNPSAITLVEDQVCHLVFRVDPSATCFAFIETDGSESAVTTTMRCLTQSRMVPDENGSLERIYKVKAVLPPGHDSGWLKIYAGQSLLSSSTRQDHNTNGTSSRQHSSSMNSLPPATTTTATETTSVTLPPLALCFHLTVQHAHHIGSGRLRPFEFVHLHPSRHEFYIREPQCYQLYPLQTYNFFVRGDDMHHKLAIKSPGGRLYKLMYYPQEHTYDGSVKMTEMGKWSLVSLLNHTGVWSVVATWECRT